jgi:transposase InsO family protein
MGCTSEQSRLGAHYDGEKDAEQQDHPSDRERRLTRRLRAMGIRDKPTAPASPWQNGFAERLIGSIRRECVDHIIVLGEMHLRRVLKSYADYYNSVRTHRSLNKDAPV